jgi:hypothetical protein
MNTADMIHRDRAYKAVISLNNAGVSLLHRHLYTEAVDTFKDAIRLMRFSFFSGESSIPEADDFDRALQAASKRTSIKQAKVEDGVLVITITDQDSPHTVYATLERNPESMFCVNIEPVENYDACDSERLEAESAWLLYNYGIAHRCAAQSTLTQWNRATRCHINNTAFQIFEMAQSVAAKLLPGSDLVASPSNVLLVSLLVTANLLHMSSHSLELIGQYSEDLEDLLATIAERELMLSGEQRGVAAAAA